MATNQEIAETIFQQLGGSRFLAMTGIGSKPNQVMAIENGVLMRLPRTLSKANRVEITVTDADLYRVEFIKFTAGRMDRRTLAWIEDKFTQIALHDGVPVENLRAIFTAETGFDCTL
jgi:hypothetical protein